MYRSLVGASLVGGRNGLTVSTAQAGGFLVGVRLVLGACPKF